MAFYLEEVNGAGHRFGPESPEVAAAVRKVDGNLAAMRARLREMGLTPNYLVVSDHGMTPTHLQRVVVLDEILDLKTVTIDSDGSLLALRPVQGTAEELVARQRLAGVGPVDGRRQGDAGGLRGRVRRRKGEDRGEHEGDEDPASA